MTDHRFCLHSATKAGRTACRKAGSPAGYHYALQQTILHDAERVCPDCFSNATEYAEGIIREANPDC